MFSLRKGRPTIILVNNDEVLFVSQDREGGGRISDPVPLDAFLAESVGPDLVPKEARQSRTHPVMVVPDYWFGSASFRFPSQKHALAESFLERKLREDLPDLPDAARFFGYFFYRTARDDRMLHAFYPREPLFFRLHDALARLRFAPRWTTTPAFLWQEKLRRRIPGFSQGGKAFVHMLTEDCFLCFFYEGNIFFTRQISLSSPSEEAPDPLETLVYETRQSLYHFSQKTNAEVDQVYLSSFGTLSAEDYARRLGIAVREFSEIEEEIMQEGVLIGLPGLLSGICLPDLTRPQSFLSVSDRRVEKQKEWKPVRVAGLVIGLLLLAFFLAENRLLENWGQPAIALSEGKGKSAQLEAMDMIRKYRLALEDFLAESRRPSPRDVILDVARALPENVQVLEVVVETEPDPAVRIQGTVQAPDPEQMGQALSAFLVRLNEFFQGSRSLTVEDIELDKDQCRTEQGQQACPIGLRFSLP